VDFGLYARIFWRFRVLVVAGFALALVAGALSVVSIGTGGVEYRQKVLWASHAQLGVTQYGFPWGRLFALNPTSGSETEDQIPVADPNRFNALAVLYARLATSDPVLNQMREDGPLGGQIVAAAARDVDSNTTLPLIDVTAVSTSPEGAVALASRSVDALQTYISDQQTSNEVPSADRVVLEELVHPEGASVFQGRSKTVPVVVFLAVMFATLGLAFVLENLRPRFRGVDPVKDTSVMRTAQRRSA
jgi:hypothetical protein